MIKLRAGPGFQTTELLGQHIWTNDSNPEPSTLNRPQPIPVQTLHPQAGKPQSHPSLWTRNMKNSNLWVPEITVRRSNRASARAKASLWPSNAACPGYQISDFATQKASKIWCWSMFFCRLRAEGCQLGPLRFGHMHFLKQRWGRVSQGLEGRQTIIGQFQLTGCAAWKRGLCFAHHDVGTLAPRQTWSWHVWSQICEMKPEIPVPGMSSFVLCRRILRILAQCQAVLKPHAQNSRATGLQDRESLLMKSRISGK